MFLGLYKKTTRFFDKFEDKVRERLSRHPIVYTFIGGIGIVLFWRGVWLTADRIVFLNNPLVSIAVSVVVLLATGLFVSFFVGDVIILSGIRREKKVIEKTEAELAADSTTLRELKKETDELKKMVEEELEHHHHHHHENK